MKRVLIALLVCVGAAAGVFWFWRRDAPPPPDIQLHNVDPEVAALVERTREEVAADTWDAVAWARLGMVSEANGLAGLARDAYEQALRLDEAQPRWHYRLAITEARLGRLDEALRHVARAIDLHGGYAPLQWRRGLWQLDRGDVAAAEEAFRRATEIDPADPGGPLGLARVHLQRDDAAAAAQVLERLLTRHPGHPHALQLLGTAYGRLGRKEESAFALAIAGEVETIWADPWTDELAQYQRGYAARLKEATARLGSGEVDAAIALLEPLRRERPDDVALGNRLAAAYLRGGRVDAAFSVLAEAELLNPTYSETQVNLASGWLRRGDAGRALAHAERAVALNRAYPRAHEAYGMALWELGRRDAALAAFEELRRHDPRHAASLVWSGMILNELGRGDEALRAFRSAADRAPALVDAWLGLAMVQMRRGDLAEAEGALSRASRLDPQHPQVAAGRAHLGALRAGPSAMATR